MTTRSGWNRRAIVDRLGDRAGLGDDLEPRPPVEHRRPGPGGRPRGRRRPGASDGRLGPSVMAWRSPRRRSGSVGRSADLDPCSGRIAVDVHGRTDALPPGSACWPVPGDPRLADRRRVEPATVVLDPKPQAAVGSALIQTIARDAPECRAMLAQRLVDDAEQMRGGRRVRFDVHRRRRAARHRSSSCGGTPRRSRRARSAGSSRSGAPAAGRR